jgi:hypothetical protein
MTVRPASFTGVMSSRPWADTVEAVDPDHAEAQLHILFKNSDDAELMVDAIRKAAGLPPKYAKPDGEGIETHRSP